VSPSNNLGKVTTRCRVGGLLIASYVIGSQALGIERCIEYTRAVTVMCIRGWTEHRC
jgi:hypothetical protein